MYLKRRYPHARLHFGLEDHNMSSIQEIINSNLSPVIC